MRNHMNDEELEASRILDYVRDPELAELDGVEHVPMTAVLWALRVTGDLTRT